MDEHGWAALEARERRDLAAAGIGERLYGALETAERATLRAVRLALTSEKLAGDLWRDVREVLWIGPNQTGLVVEDAARLYRRALEARRASGVPVFAPDPRWLLALFKERAEWSLREASVAEWGVQIYRRGRPRRVAGEIVVDLDRVTLAAGLRRHVRDVRAPNADPLDAWQAIASRFKDENSRG